MKLCAYPWGEGMVSWLMRPCYRPCVDLKKSCNPVGPLVSLGKGWECLCRDAGCIWQANAVSIFPLFWKKCVLLLKLDCWYWEDSKKQWSFWLAPGLAGCRAWAAIPSSPLYHCSGLNVTFKSRGSQLLPTGCMRIRFWETLPTPCLSLLALGGRYHHCHGLRSLGKKLSGAGLAKRTTASVSVP